MEYEPFIKFSKERVIRSEEKTSDLVKSIENENEQNYGKY